MSQWNSLPDNSVIQATSDALKNNGIQVIVVANKEEAKQKMLELIPKGSEVMTMSSQTNEIVGINQEMNESGNYDSVKKKFSTMDPKTQQQEMNALGAAPQYAIGSVHAVTEDGRVIIVSATGSQLPAYAYSAMNAVWIVGAQKLVKTLDDGFKRINEYVFPLEDGRALKAYGAHSGINKILIINKENRPGRLTMIIVKEVLGF